MLTLPLFWGGMNSGRGRGSGRRKGNSNGVWYILFVRRRLPSGLVRDFEFSGRLKRGLKAEMAPEEGGILSVLEWKAADAGLFLLWKKYCTSELVDGADVG